MNLFRRKKDNTLDLPPLPAIEDAKDALKSAQEAYRQTPRMRWQQRLAADVYVQAILEAIAAKKKE